MQSKVHSIARDNIGNSNCILALLKEETLNRVREPKREIGRYSFASPLEINIKIEYKDRKQYYLYEVVSQTQTTLL